MSNSDVQIGLTAGSGVAIPDGVKVTNDPATAIPVRFDQRISPLGSVNVNNTTAQAIPVTLHGSDDTPNLPTIPYEAGAVTDKAPGAAW